MSTVSNLSGVKWVVVLLSVLGGIIASVALYHHVVQMGGFATEPSFCNISAHINCDAVNSSEWSSFFGIPVAAYGVFFFFSLGALLVVSGERRAVSISDALSVGLVGGLVASICSIALFAISEFIIGALCLLCLGLYLVSFLIFGVLWLRAFRGALGLGLRTGFGALGRFIGGVLGVRNGVWLARSGAFGLALFAVVCAYLPTMIHGVLAANRPQSMKFDPVSAWRSSPRVEVRSRVGVGAFDDFAKGSESASIDIVEFADFECPGCRRLYVEMRDLLSRFEGSYRLTFRNYPLDNECNPLINREFHRYACVAAYFTRCAAEQGKFWEALDLVFTDPIMESESSRDEVREFFVTKGAGQLGLDGEAIRECLSSNRYKQKILEDIEEGTRIGLMSTPSIWINGRKVERPTISALEGVLREAASSR